VALRRPHPFEYSITGAPVDLPLLDRPGGVCQGLKHVIAPPLSEALIAGGRNVDYDGESTEVQKCGFGLPNHNFGDGNHVGNHGRYTLGSRRLYPRDSFV